MMKSKVGTAYDETTFIRCTTHTTGKRVWINAAEISYIIQEDAYTFIAMRQDTVTLHVRESAEGIMRAIGRLSYDDNE